MDNHKENEVPMKKNKDHQDPLSSLSSLSTNYIDNLRLPNSTQEASTSELRRFGRLNN